MNPPPTLSRNNLSNGGFAYSENMADVPECQFAFLSHRSNL